MWNLIVDTRRAVIEGLWLRFQGEQVEVCVRRERRRRILQTLVWFVVTLVLALFTPDIGRVISMIGGLAACFIFVFPGNGPSLLCAPSLSSEVALASHKCLFMSLNLSGLCLIQAKLSETDNRSARWVALHPFFSTWPGQFLNCSFAPSLLQLARINRLWDCHGYNRSFYLWPHDNQLHISGYCQLKEACCEGQLCPGRWRQSGGTSLVPGCFSAPLDLMEELVAPIPQSTLLLSERWHASPRLQTAFHCWISSVLILKGNFNRQPRRGPRGLQQ